MLRAVVGRRELLRRAAAFGLALPWAGVGGPAAAAETALVARRVFFDTPDYQGVQISPDGEHIAYTAPLDGVRNLWVAPTADPQSGKPVTHITGRDIGRYYRWAYTNRHLIFFQDHDGDENWRASSVDLGGGAPVLLTPEKGAQSYLQELDPKFPEEALLRHNQRDKRYHDIVRVNLLTGKSELVFENRDYAWLVTDGVFRVRLGMRFAKDGSAEVMELKPTGNWVPFMTIPIGDLDSTDLLDFSPDGNTLYLIDSRGRDKGAFTAIDMTTRDAKVLAEDPEADIAHVDFCERVPLAANANRLRVKWYPIADGAAKNLALLAAYGPGDVEISSHTKDNSRAVAYYGRDTASGEYALLDSAAGVVKRLYLQSKALAGVKLQPLEPVEFAARDGLKLTGYLTRPGEPAGPGKPPLVMVIHGGPYARDQWGFSSTHQWLANRGYAVLSVNYRGSTGFGKAFVTAADREWGGKMHDDLIDALDWAIAQGVADLARVGFFGGSYGGYSALMAATKTPERFACIVDLFGISNLITFMKTIPPYWGPWFSVWKNRLGDPDTEAGRAWLNDRSPLNHLDRATKPILIAQGSNDVRVVAAESEQMVKALTAKGVPVTYVSFPDEGHGFVRPENRLAFNAVAEAFLAKHLGGRYQPVGDDFAGSTIKIETGGALIPGLAH